MSDATRATDRCVFCEYALRGMPAHGIYEDEDVMVLLDTSPRGVAHTLIVPRAHVPRIYELRPEQQTRLFALAARIVPLLLKLTHKSAVAYVASGSGMPHAQLHLIPHNESDELVHARAIDTDREELERTAARLRASAQSLAPKTPFAGMFLMMLAVAMSSFYTIYAIGPALALVLYVIGSSIVADSGIPLRRKLLLTLVPAAVIAAMLIIAFSSPNV